MSRLSATEANDVRRMLRSRYVAGRKAQLPGEQPTPEMESLRSQIGATTELRNKTLRADAAQDATIRTQARDPSGAGAAYTPPDILDPNYVAAVRAYSDQVSRAAPKGPSAAERAAPFMQAKQAGRLGVTGGDLAKMTALRGTPSAAMGAMDNRDLERSELSKRLPSPMERTAREYGDRAFNAEIDVAPPEAGRPRLATRSEESASRVMGGAEAARRRVLSGILGDGQAAPSATLPVPVAPGDTPTNREALNAYIGRRDTAMKPVLAARQGDEATAAGNIVARGVAEREAERDRADKMRGLQDRLALAGVLGAEKEAGVVSPELPVDPMKKVADDDAALAAGLAGAGYDPESAMERIGRFASDLGSFTPNYGAIAASMDEWLSSLPPNIRGMVAKQIDSRLISTGARKRSLLGRALTFSPLEEIVRGVRGRGFSDRNAAGNAAVDSVLRKHKGG